jgi:hypothetical protein
MENLSSLTALWGAVIFSGIYHGFNPAMGWPLAVSAALFEQKKKKNPPYLKQQLH